MEVNPYVFREYDIRGVAGRDLTEEFAHALGLAIGTYFHRNGARRISLGMDCRLSSPVLSEHLKEGLLETGRQVTELGIVPTPLVYFSTFTMDVQGAVQITGSHNPPDENGFKVCLGTSTLYGPQIQQIRAIMEQKEFVKGRGEAVQVPVTEAYKRHVLQGIDMGPVNRKVVLDCGNGTAGLVAPGLYRQMGVDVVELFSEPDGRFPNHHPDPTVPKNLEALIRTVSSQGADLGIAFDGDADRIGVVDEGGQILWGDQLMIIFSRDILSKNPGAKIIAEVKCSQTLFDDVKAHGGQPIMWKVGHSLIKSKMKDEGALLAGEMSGHLFFSDRYFGYDDAIYAGARLLEILSKREGKLSGLIADVPKVFNTPEIRIPCPDDRKFQVVEGLKEAFRESYPIIDVDGVRVRFPDGWGLVRASNTQPVLVLRFEATDQQALDRIHGMVRGRLEEMIGSC